MRGLDCARRKSLSERGSVGCGNSAINLKVELASAYLVRKDDVRFSDLWALPELEQAFNEIDAIVLSR
jgi:hypothetical protein